MTADILANLARKLKTTKEAQRVLGLVHPIVMENVVVGAGGVLRLRFRDFHWVRRQGWHGGKNDQWSEGR